MTDDCSSIQRLSTYVDALNQVAAIVGLPGGQSLRSVIKRVDSVVLRAEILEIQLDAWKAEVASLSAELARASRHCPIDTADREAHTMTPAQRGGVAC